MIIKRRRANVHVRPDGGLRRTSMHGGREDNEITRFCQKRFSFGRGQGSQSGTRRQNRCGKREAIHHAISENSALRGLSSEYSSANPVVTKGLRGAKNYRSAEEKKAAREDAAEWSIIGGLLNYALRCDQPITFSNVERHEFSHASTVSDRRAVVDAY
jgi:hypothetical protein